MSTQRHGECLDATADAEDGQLTIVCQLGDEEFGEVALGIDGAQLRPGLFARIVRVVVGTPAEDQCVEALQGVDDDLRIAQWRNDDGDAASTHDRLVVALSELTCQFAIVARDANDWFAGSFGKGSIG